MNSAFKLVAPVLLCTICMVIGYFSAGGGLTAGFFASTGADSLGGDARVTIIVPGGGTINLEEAKKSLVHKFSEGGEPDRESLMLLVKVLSYDPKFINTIYNSSPPLQRKVLMGLVFQTLASDFPKLTWRVANAAQFDLGKDPNFALCLRTSFSSAPESGLEYVWSHQNQISKSDSSVLLQIASCYPASAKRIIDEFLIGRVVPDNVLANAISSLLVDGVAIPDKLKESKAYHDVTDVKLAESWLRGGQMSAEEVYRLSAHALQQAIHSVVNSNSGQLAVDPEKFTNLLGAKNSRNGEILIAEMIRVGREGDALALLERSVSAGLSESATDGLLDAGARCILENGGDVGKVVSILNRIGSDASYWRAIQASLCEWARYDPVAAEQMAAGIEDRATREFVIDAARKSRVKP